MANITVFFINGKVYCNIYPEGLPEQQWINSFHDASGPKPIVTRNEEQKGKDMDHNLTNLLNTLQERPGIYIGKKSLDRLVTFVYGYIHCINERDDVLTNFLPGFQEFVMEHYNLHNNIYVFRHWSDIISFFNATEEEAFDEFYKLLDEFSNQKRK